MSIPFTEQPFVEKERNLKYQWLAFVGGIAVLALHGIVFHWIPYFIRCRRGPDLLTYKPMYRALAYWLTFNRSYRIPFWRWTYYFQPSMVLLLLGYFGLNGYLCICDTDGLDNFPWSYVVGKRIGRICTGNMPLVLCLIMKNDLWSSISGLQHDKLALYHKWVGRFIWGSATAHMYICMMYWLDLKFDIMIKIPPQYFGFIAYASLSVLTWGSVRFIRNLAWDVFLVQHRVNNFIMLLFSYFHNSGGHAIVLLAVHALVADRVVNRIVCVVHKRMAPSKGLSKFELLDENTVRVTIDVKRTKMDGLKWYYSFIPKVGTWKAGQHIWFNMAQVYGNQYHPFTVSSLASSGKMVLVIRKQRGFTRKLVKKLETELPKSEEDRKKALNHKGPIGKVIGFVTGLIKLAIVFAYKQVKAQIEAHSKPKDEDTSTSDIESVLAEEFDPAIVKLKSQFYGPFGGQYQPLITFDAVHLFAAGSGASFVFPVCLDLLQQIEQREAEQDFFNRPRKARIALSWVIKKWDNIAWYDHIVPLLEEYVLKGMLELNIYITQEKRLEPVLSSSSTHLDSKLLGGSSVEKTEIIKTGTSSSVASDTNYIYRRPDLEDIITHEAHRLIGNDKFKGLAVLSCGPPAFTYTIRSSCLRNKHIKNGPEVYCYTESF